VKVAVPLFQGFQLLDVVGPMDVFHAANAITGEMFYELCLAAPSAGPVTCSNGAAVEVSTELSDVQSPFDVIIVPGGAPFMEEDERRSIVEWLRSVGPDTPRLASVCTGAFILASTGLADERRMTTHWRDARRLAQEYPAVRVDADRICTKDGNIYSSGGITAGIDLAMALVAEDLGESVTREVAKMLLSPRFRQGSQRQFSDLEGLRAGVDEPTRPR
jgi:transcriptional regulator GlxA family with amidase domain